MTASALLVLMFVQIYLGALVAGLRAGLIYNTWPLIDGALIPAAARLWFEKPWWRNLFENTLTVQFDHRMMAYVLALLAPSCERMWSEGRDHDAMAGALRSWPCVGSAGCARHPDADASGADRSWRWRIRRWRCWC